MTPDDMARLHLAAYDAGRPWTAAEFAGLLRADTTFHVGDTHGFAVVRCVLDEAELLTIVVHRAWRKRGIARGLMAAWHDRARDAGAARAYLEVARDNAPARALYAGCGYAVTGCRAGYYDGGIDALLMSRSLTPG
ncbi:MAG: GNAT family N-acetyltransferase [Rhodobacteraceae bacterium]|nr:GNAT family N-acetyltransferase [Paracoccaceae bacterium]